MSDPVTLWRRDADPALHVAPVFTTGYHLPTDTEYRATPADDFERMAADARGLRWLIDASKHPGNAALRKAMEDLGVSEPAGPPVKVMFFQSSGPRPFPGACYANPASPGVTV